MAIALLSSCSTPKDITYMQGFENGQQIAVVDSNKRISIKPNDKITILVSAKDPVLADVFNLAISQRQVGQNLSSASTGVRRTSTANAQTAYYNVTPEGEINFPVIGYIKVAGMERFIYNRLSDENLLKDAVVSVEFQNATVSILGDVNAPGEYAIDRDDLNLIQAISKAGDLQITGMRKNVLVVRKDNGIEKAYRVDLTDTQSLFNSPVYHLQQDDIVYVEPNTIKKRQSTPNGNSVLTPSFWLSIASFITTVAVLVVQ
jgi:polysaccharide export outer membrane protein